MSTTEVNNGNEAVELLKNLMRQDWLVKVQFFDRKKGQWSKMLAPQVGFSEAFRQDEDTDDASINFKWRSEEKPNLQHMQWVRILHFAKGEELKAKYDVNGYPLNHNQYVLGNFQYAQNKDKKSWLVKMSLLEPIERMKYVVGETLAYTNQTSKTVTDGSGNKVTYVKEPFNHLTALERFLKVTPANCDNYDEGYDPHQNKSWFNRVKILDKEFLKNIPFDSDSFTEPDLYTVLFKYDKTTGRTPCMYFDMDPETDLPRNMERDEYLLIFLRQDGYDMPELKLEDLLEGAQNVTYKSNVANFATGVVSNVENLVTGSNTPFPFYKMFAVPEINNNSRDLTSYNKSDSGWGLHLPFPIKRVNKVVRRAAYFGSVTSTLSTSYSAFSDDIDLTNMCFENQQYNALDLNQYKKEELLHYTEGDDFIYINNYYYKKEIKSDEAYSSFYYLEFEPFIDSKLINGDEEFATIFNQVDSQVDYNKFNKHLQKYIDSMAKSDLTFIKKHWHYNEIYPVGSRVVDEKDNKIYMITGVAYQNINFELVAVYQLNENHFRRSNSVKASKSIRANSAIEFTNVKRRNIAINKEISINDIFKDTAPQYHFFFNPFCFIKEKIPQCVLISTTSILKDEKNNNIEYKKHFVLPIVCIAEDNKMLFVFNFKDNALIGKDKYLGERQWSETPSGTYTTISFKVYCPTSQIDILYTDPFGCVDKLNMEFCSNPQDIAELDINGKGELNKSEFDKLLLNYKRLATVSINDESIQELRENLVFSFNLNILKDCLEKPNILFSINNKNKNIILTKDYITSILNNETVIDLENEVCVDFYNREIDINDSKCLNPIFSCTAKVNIVSPNEIKFSLVCSEEIETIKSLCIREKIKNKALIIVNKPNKDMLKENYYKMYM